MTFKITTYEPPRVKTNKMTVRPAKIQQIRPDWSESSLYAQLVAKDPIFLHADSEDSDQTGRMPRLIWVFAGRTAILLVLSRGGSYVNLMNDLIQQNRALMLMSDSVLLYTVSEM